MMKVIGSEAQHGDGLGVLPLGRVAPMGTRNRDEAR
jgi:hypothetical protein